MDVKTTLLNGVVEEEVYVEQPLGFETHDKETHVCKLNKAQYGLKQAPRTCYGRIDSSWLVWDLPRVKRIPIITTRLNKGTHKYSYYM